MKKILVFLVALSFVLGLCACGAVPGETPSSQPEQPIESELRTLFDRNIDCNIIFYLSFLDHDDKLTDEGLYKVIDARFPTFTALDEFVRSTYTAEFADNLLNEERVTGHHLYNDVDGALYIDSYVMGGKGYYVDWTDYSINIVSTTEEKCEFTVTAQVTWPGENPAPEDYEKTAYAVKENGAWRLTEIVY